MLNGVKFLLLSPRSRTITRQEHLLSLFNIVHEVLARTKRQKGEIKRIQIGKKEIQ